MATIITSVTAPPISATARDESENLFNLTKAELRKKERTDELHESIHRCFKCLVWLIAGILAFAVFVYAWHNLAPDCWCWLDKDQVHKLETTVFGFLIGGVSSVVWKNVSKTYS